MFYVYHINPLVLFGHFWLKL